jgi:hypothetical protein
MSGANMHFPYLGIVFVLLVLSQIPCGRIYFGPPGVPPIERATQPKTFRTFIAIEIISVLILSYFEIWYGP